MKDTTPEEEWEGNVNLLIGLIVLGIRLVIILFGLVGNTISLTVWSRPNLKSSSSVVLVALAVSDTLVIVCGLWFELPLDYNVLNRYNGNPPMPDPINVNYILNYYSQWSAMLSRTVYKMAVTTSMYLTVIITVERFICVCHPFQFNEWCTYSRTFKITAITILLAVVYNMSHFWEYRVVGKSFLVEGKNITVYMQRTTALLFDRLYVRVYIIWMFVIIDYILPLTCIITLNTITCIKLKRMNSDRRAISDSRSNENKLTKMVIYVVVEFLVCTSFSGFIALDAIYHGTGRQTLSLNFVLRQVRDTLNVLNSSVNFVTYISCWPPFRRTFIQMFCCHKKLNQPTPVSPGNPDQTSNSRITPV